MARKQPRPPNPNNEIKLAIAQWKIHTGQPQYELARHRDQPVNAFTDRERLPPRHPIHRGHHPYHSKNSIGGIYFMVRLQNQSGFMQLIGDLEKNFNVTFISENEIEGKVFALEASKQKNLELIDREFSDVVVLIQSKLPYIQSLAALNDNLDREIEQLKRQLTGTERTA